MSKDERQFLEELRARSVEAAAEIMESLQRLKNLYDEIGDDGSGNVLPRPRPADFFYRLARVEMEHAANVIKLGNSQADMIFDHIRQLARRTKGVAAPTTVVDLVLDPETHRYVGRFEIKNPFDKPADARFEIGRMRDASGQEQDARPDVACGGDPVGAYRVAPVEISLAQDRVDKVLFGEITVFLVGDVERQVAKRAIKVRPERK